ncbi:NERD domain-containing protein [Erythrobacter litoralis]|uniref:nuclease-related domain-containing protein n=1 Tax=Erythrobacter litoralis TaxID=39960 RepID=UPI00243562A3|nr:nuclease-related domain-containing protein [Erythrobacter litoralis]MDG6078103.1 NERD domain-containing protein [Erythrobacter litoralis]
MLLKQAEGSSNDLKQLEDLRTEVSPEYRPKIDSQIARLRKGEAGEKTTAHFLNRELGASDRIGILHDLRLEVEGDVAQIDHLVIHRVQQAAWVLESKNYSGNLSCDEHGDWTIWYGKKPTPIASPVNQARRQIILLRRWLDKEDVTTIRTITPVVLISPTSSINRKNLPADAHVVKSDNFAQWWSKQAEQIGVKRALGMFGRHLANSMSSADLETIGHRLAGAHIPANRDWRARLGIPDSASVVQSDETPIREHHSHTPLKTIETVYGTVTISRLPDGRLALRNAPNEELISVVKTACKGRARWNPRFKNLVFDPSSFDEIREVLVRAT